MSLTWIYTHNEGTAIQKWNRMSFVLVSVVCKYEWSGGQRPSLSKAKASFKVQLRKPSLWGENPPFPHFPPEVTLKSTLGRRPNPLKPSLWSDSGQPLKGSPFTVN